MNKLLGLDDLLLAKAGLVERAGYRLVNTLFLAVTSASLISNGYFGYLLLRTWYGALSIALLMGYIHFSVIRIALITLMTKPMIDSNRNTQSPQQITGRIRKALEYVRQLNAASILRFVFMGLIAITISIPFSTIFFHDKAIEVEQKYRTELSAEFNAQGTSDDVILHELEQAHYPFVMFEKLSGKGAYRFIVLLMIVFVFAPLAALARLRYGKNNKYVELCREEMHRDILIDYQECLEQSQYHLDKHFPHFERRLTDLTPFADAPFRLVLRNTNRRSLGTTDEFRQFMRSL